MKATTTFVANLVTAMPSCCGAVVTGAWIAGSPATSSCTTGMKSRCDMTSGALSYSRGSVTFAVTGVSSTAGAYSAALNHEPDRDSNGTSIVISR